MLIVPKGVMAGMTLALYPPVINNFCGWLWLLLAFLFGAYLMNNELEAFRYAHDCDESEWYTNDDIRYYCICEREVLI